MKIASVADIKAHFSAYLRAAERGPVVVTRNGKPAGVLLVVADEEEDLERLVLAYSPRLRRILDADEEVNLTIELDREEDGRWIAEALELPGVGVTAAVGTRPSATRSALPSRSLRTASPTVSFPHPPSEFPSPFQMSN